MATALPVLVHEEGLSRSLDEIRKPVLPPVPNMAVAAVFGTSF